MSRLARGTIGLALLLAVLHGAAWWYVSGQVLDGIPGFVAAATREGWTITSGPPRRAGWPLAAAVELPGVEAVRPLGGTTIRWSAERVTIAVAAAEPDVLRIAPGGTNTLRYGAAAPVPLAATSAVLRLRLDGTGPTLLHMDGFHAGTPDSGIGVASIDAQFLPGVVALTAGPVLLAPALQAPFDGGATIAFRAEITPPFPTAASPAESARAWQAAGGRIVVPELSLDWGPAQLAGTLGGRLDAGLQPEGEAALRLHGASQVLEAAAQAGLVAPGPAAAMRAVLGLLEAAARGGPVPVPVRMERGVVTVSQFPLLRLPRLDWDAR